MSKESQSFAARYAIWREREVQDLRSLVKEGNSVYVYGMPTCGLAEILRDVCAGLDENFFKIKFSMLRIGEDEHNESGIASAIIGECDGFYNDHDRKTIFGVIKVLRKIIQEYRVVIQIDYFDSFCEKEDVRIVSDLIEQVRSELADGVSFIVSGCHTPLSRIFSEAGVGVLLGNLEKYPVAPLRGNCIRQFIEKKYREKGLDERKVLDIFEATAGDPKLIDCLHNVRWSTDSRGLTENEKRKFQLSVQSFVDTVISVYGMERVPAGKSTVEDVWTGKTLNELTPLGCNELSAIGVLSDGKYKLPGLVVDYMVEAPSRLPSLSLLGEVGETGRCEHVGIAPETAQNEGRPDGKRKAGGQSSKKCGAVEGSDNRIWLAFKKNNKVQTIKVRFASDFEKIIRGKPISIKQGVHKYEITSETAWKVIDSLLDAVKCRESGCSWVPWKKEWDQKGPSRVFRGTTALENFYCECIIYANNQIKLDSRIWGKP